MIIETTTQEYSTHEVGRIVIDDTLDLIIVNKGDNYSIKIVNNNCIDVDVEEVEIDETDIYFDESEVE